MRRNALAPPAISAVLAERIAAKVAHLPNRAAWREAQRLIEEAEVPNRMAVAMRDAVWGLRRQGRAVSGFRAEGGRGGTPSAD